MLGANRDRIVGGTRRMQHEINLSPPRTLERERVTDLFPDALGGNGEQRRFQTDEMGVGGTGWDGERGSQDRAADDKLSGDAARALFIRRCGLGDGRAVEKKRGGEDQEKNRNPPPIT